MSQDVLIWCRACHLWMAVQMAKQPAVNHVMFFHVLCISPETPATNEMLYLRLT